MISGFHYATNDIFILLGCSAVYVGGLLPKFRDNLLVPFVKRPKNAQGGSKEASKIA
jgi:hypothetical protein